MLSSKFKSLIYLCIHAERTRTTDTWTDSQDPVTGRRYSRVRRRNHFSLHLRRRVVVNVLPLRLNLYLSSRLPGRVSSTEPVVTPGGSTGGVHFPSVSVPHGEVHPCPRHPYDPLYGPLGTRRGYPPSGVCPTPGPPTGRTRGIETPSRDGR